MVTISKTRKSDVDSDANLQRRTEAQLFKILSSFVLSSQKNLLFLLRVCVCVRVCENACVCVGCTRFLHQIVGNLIMCSALRDRFSFAVYGSIQTIVYKRLHMKTTFDRASKSTPKLLLVARLMTATSHAHARCVLLKLTTACAQRQRDLIPPSNLHADLVH